MSRFSILVILSKALRNQGSMPVLLESSSGLTFLLKADKTAQSLSSLGPIGSVLSIGWSSVIQLGSSHKIDLLVISNDLTAF